MAFKFPPLTPEQQERVDAIRAEEASRIPIEATFVTERGRWVKDIRDYVDITEVTKVGTITMKIIDSTWREGEKVLQFYGGPTGAEAYNIEPKLIECLREMPDEFCICAGTINSWDKCTIKASDVLAYLEKEGY
jgi:hypothetical protein